MFRELTALEKQLSIAKGHNSYCKERLSVAVSGREIRILLAAIEENNKEIAAIEAEMKLNV
jgi:hypothetical protein